MVAKEVIRIPAMEPMLEKNGQNQAREDFIPLTIADCRDDNWNCAVVGDTRHAHEGRAMSVEVLIRQEISTSSSEISCAAEKRSSPPILCLGAARTGTASLGAALNELGIERVHHGLKVFKEAWQWDFFDLAADATFPNLKSYTGRPFTRADWDYLMRHYDAITDLGSFFAVSLLAAYPDAKVILVERDIERWHKSVSVLFEPWTHRSRRLAMRIIGPLAESKSGLASFKMCMGWTESEKPKALCKNARAAYVRHYETIRATVPKEQLLEYRLTDGWEPLAKFLGKKAPGPGVPFPHVNDAKEFKKVVDNGAKYFLKKATKNFFRPCFWLGCSHEADAHRQ